MNAFVAGVLAPLARDAVRTMDNAERMMRAFSGGAVGAWTWLAVVVAAACVGALAVHHCHAVRWAIAPLTGVVIGALVALENAGESADMRVAGMVAMLGGSALLAAGVGAFCGHLASLFSRLPSSTE